MDTQQQNSGASGVTQAVAPAPSAPSPQIAPQPQPEHTTPTPTPRQDLVPRALLDSTTQESIKRKQKAKALKTERDTLKGELGTTATERDGYKAKVEALEARIAQQAERMAEAALTQSLTSRGFTADAARLLLPALRPHVSVDAETYEVKLAEEEIEKAAAHLKPTPQPQTPASQRALGLHQANAAARTPTLPAAPMSARERLRAEARALSGKAG